MINLYLAASFCAHLACHLYIILVEAHRCFSTTIVLSGDGGTCRTGKSLMTSCWQLAFLGEYPTEQQIKVTEATLFKELNSGRPVYRKYPLNCIHLQLCPGGNLTLDLKYDKWKQAGAELGQAQNQIGKLHGYISFRLSWLSAPLTVSVFLVGFLLMMLSSSEPYCEVVS